MVYQPEPVNTDDVELDASVLALVEQLARNAHDVWALQRLKDGWVYGPGRDEARKEHNCLVPYEELPESEKVYDRNTALGTLKLITKLGYRIARS